jgi:hypothetical protein
VIRVRLGLASLPDFTVEAVFALVGTLLLTAAIAYVWYAYAEAFSLFLYHHAAHENALTLYRDGPAIFAGLLFAGLIVVSMTIKAISHRHRGDGLWSSGPVRSAREAPFRRLTKDVGRA